MTVSKYVKDEIASPPQKQCCRRARFSAFLRTAGSLLVGADGVKVQLSTDNPSVSEFAAAYVFERYGGEVSIKKGKHIKVLFSGDYMTRLLAETGVISSDKDGYSNVSGIANYLVKGGCCIKEYVKGAFLGCGFISSSISHLEFAFSSLGVAKDFAELLSSALPAPGIGERGDKTLVYYKNKSTICDVLIFMGAMKSVLEVHNTIALMDLKKQATRESNCDIANIDRALKASGEQLRSIAVIDEKMGIEKLDEKQQTIAYLRKAYPEATLAELSEISGLTKSGVRHRLDKLTALAAALK